MMDGKLRNMTSVYLTNADHMLLLLRQGGRVVNNVWVGSAGDHFEMFELNDAKACVLRELEEELNLKEKDIYRQIRHRALLRNRMQNRGNLRRHCRR